MRWSQLKADPSIARDHRGIDGALRLVGPSLLVRRRVRGNTAGDGRRTRMRRTEALKARYGRTERPGKFDNKITDIRFPCQNHLVWKPRVFNEKKRLKLHIAEQSDQSTQ
eukprot:192013-Amphidinium_carterae.1